MSSSTPQELLSNPPCFRSGLLWGIATGALIGAHRFRTTRQVRTACDWAVLTFGGVAAGSWLVCRSTYITRVQQTRQFMEVMNNPEKKAEAEQFFRSRVETQQPQQQPQQQPRDESA
ncbi:hypothetical protein PybrP1_009251 [[Pythium] brassicae (nom. inval.)]|nr:hypothetical protein PybrP1_009251 [[Pythium] brassicae (nom. inval.)]